jgi:hypothetical protein
MSMMEMIVGGQVASRVRRNHGLEHATLHVLAEHLPRVNLAGHSDPNGFWIVGDVSTEDVIDAAAEALRRLKEGEHELAVHPVCCPSGWADPSGTGDHLWRARSVEDF